MARKRKKRATQGDEGSVGVKAVRMLSESLASQQRGMVASLSSLSDMSSAMEQVKPMELMPSIAALVRAPLLPDVLRIPNMFIGLNKSMTEHPRDLEWTRSYAPAPNRAQMRTAQLEREIADLKARVGFLTNRLGAHANSDTAHEPLSDEPYDPTLPPRPRP